MVEEPKEMADKPHLTNDPEDSMSAPDRALVVDDDIHVTEIVTLALERVGYIVDSVGSAVEALELFEQNRPDIVISDWRMPGMNGIELVTQLKQQDPTLAAILMTGYGTKETVVEAFTRGKINYYLSKPFQLNELLEVVGAAMKERRVSLSEHEFRLRLENEIHQATQALEEKNRLLEQKNRETEALNRELRLRTEEVEGTKNYLEDILESSVDAIISIDEKQRITFFSRGAEEMFGYTGDEILGTNIGRLFPSKGQQRDQLFTNLTKKKRLKHFEAELVKKNGDQLITAISASGLRGKGREAGLLLIIKDIAEQKRLEEKLRSSNVVLERLSITDGLTGLYNHRHFQKCLLEEFQRAKRYRSTMALIMLDLDDFKNVNDTFGHQVGDQVLMLLADLIRECVREVDIPARYGGEEFAIILPQTELEDAIVVAQRIKDAIETSPRFQDINPDLYMTASLGVSGVPDPGIQDTKGVIRFADKALYRAKQIGKNRVVLGSSHGETPLGRGERLTQAEKKIILRRVSDTLRGMLDLDAVLAYILKEVSGTLRQTEQEPPCSIMLPDNAHGLITAASSRMDTRRVKDFEFAAKQALKNRNVFVIEESRKRGPVTSYPVIVEWPNKGEEIVGVINIGTVPADLDFFRDLAIQAAMGLVNARLYRELEKSKQSLEKRVNQLLTLSQMSLALQGIRSAAAKAERDDHIILAKNLVMAGFDRALVYDLDLIAKRLGPGVGSHKGIAVNERLSLSRYKSEHALIQAILRPAEPDSGLGMVLPAKTITPPERRLLKKLGLVSGDIALAKLTEGESTIGVVLVSGTEITPEDGHLLSMFARHASLISENLKLATKFRDRTERLAMIHEIGQDLCLADTPLQRSQSVQAALIRLTRVLGAQEISLYLYDEDSDHVQLLAYTSASAKPGRAPIRLAKLNKSPLMYKVLQSAMHKGRRTPLIINDLEKTRKRYKTATYLGLPIMSAGKLLGVLNLTDKEDLTPFTRADADLALATAGMLAPVLGHLTLCRQVEQRSMEAVRTMVASVESRKSPGRTDRIASTVIGMGKAMGLDEDTVEALNRLVWSRAMEMEVRDVAFQDDAPVGKVWSAMSDWFEGMCHFDIDTRIGDGVEDDLAVRLIPIAEHFVSEYLERPASDRPGLPNVLWSIIEQAGARYDADAVAALTRLLVQDGLKTGRRRIRLDEAEKTDLKNHLAKPKTRSFLPSHLVRTLREIVTSKS
jgi:two-component system cell cycle response regulator